MSIKPFALAPILVLTFALPALAQPSPTMVRQFGDWNLYSYQNGGSKNCYILTMPKQALPASVSHGDNYFLVAPKPSGTGYYPQAIMGYDVKSGSQMTVSVGDASFTMTPKGNSGWTERDGDDEALINAMRGGAQMTLKAVSGRGTETSYTFSLTGVSAALDGARACR
jgi:hypothetical protein